MITIDGTDMIMGRLASIVAKKAMLGEEVNIVNCQNVLITGTKKDIMADYVHRIQMGSPRKGPFLHRSPDKLVRRAVRGMLPVKQEKGEKAFKRIKCYKGIPESLKDQKQEVFDKANIAKVPNLKYMRVGDLSRLISGRE
jgi:large subunit ribosomal protein L13